MGESCLAFLPPLREEGMPAGTAAFHAKQRSPGSPVVRQSCASQGGVDTGGSEARGFESEGPDRSRGPKLGLEG
jgi:hypothetical protein